MDGAKKKITYTTSDKKVCTVNSKGRVRAVGCGFATITVKCGKETKKLCIVVVGKQGKYIHVYARDYFLDNGLIKYLIK